MLFSQLYEQAFRFIRLNERSGPQRSTRVRRTDPEARVHFFMVAVTVMINHSVEASSGALINPLQERLFMPFIHPGKRFFSL